MNENLDLFAGAGGWDLGPLRFDGAENMAAARATRDAAGLDTPYEDVTEIEIEPGQYRRIVGGPPCQTFSMAGSGSGRRDLDTVLRGVREVVAGRPAPQTADPRTRLVLEPLRLILAGRPESGALEQVRTVLPVWRAYAEVLAEIGYSCWTGILNAEQYGVPQTRRRAILIFRRDGVQAAPPVPTHSRYYEREPERLDPGVRPWVSVAEALGWPDGLEVVSNYGTGGDPAARGRRAGDQPSATVTEKIGRNRIVIRSGSQANGTKRDLDQPAGTVIGQRSGNMTWALRNNSNAKSCTLAEDQPAGTLFFGQRMNDVRWISLPDGEFQAKVTPEEAAALQTFPAGYPFQGAKGKLFLQIGNAIPRLMANAILETLL